MASPSTVLAQARTDLGEAFEQFDLEMQKRGYIAGRVLPIFEVQHASGVFPVVPIESLLQNRSLLRASNAGYSRSTFTFTEQNYRTQEYGTEEPVDTREKHLYATYLDIEVVATKRAVEAVLNGAEQRMVTKLTDTAVITQTAAAGAPWSMYTTASPITDFNIARDAIWAATGIWANAVVMSRRKFNHIRECLQIIDRVKNNSNYRVLNGEISEAMIATAFDVEQVIVAGSAKNSAKEGQTAVVASVWPDDKVLVTRIASTGDIKEPCIGRTFHWAEDGSQPLGTVETYRDETVRGDVVRVRHEVDENIIYPKTGYLITAA